MYIALTHSTNTLMREQYLDREDLFSLYTFHQTAGRGQAGNSWESEAGKNLLFSTLLQSPAVAPAQQFRLNMAISLAVTDILPTEVCIKWPNDIYAGDRKLCGILIETLLSGATIRHAIAGVGLNVNQTEWKSDAPNPISLKQLTGKDYDLHLLMGQAQEAIASRMVMLREEPNELRREYMARLYRREGWHPYVLRDVSIAPSMPVMGEQQQGMLMAQFEDIDEQGQLVLRHEDGSVHAYHFKQIRFVIPR
ncbi:MAG: biotin--[Paludibacteraceae bacterium]|nr:biotin--[acetyl-CoA-carboxylase] ligase [Paludibacteraceae bacterium]MBR1481309.1 biotin--[acetyl-CoA-carboxylase] ligase [Paludibacteraceae bacterium]